MFNVRFEHLQILLRFPNVASAMR